MEEQFVEEFFLRTDTCFHPQRKITRQPLARRHAESDARFFRRLVQLNDHSLLGLVVNQCDRFAFEFCLMTQGRLKKEIREINGRKHQLTLATSCRRPCRRCT